MNRREFVSTSAHAAVGVTLAARWAAGQEAGDNVPRRYLHCTTHRLDMERGFKFHCLVPQDTEAGFGKHEYAGFATVRVGEQPWMFVGDVPPEHGLVPKTLQDLNRGRFSIVRSTATWRVEEFADWNAMYPATWLSARVRSAEAGAIVGALMGWGWAERATPARWFAEGEALDRAAGGVLQLPARCGWVGTHDEHGPFSAVVAFGQPPEALWADDDGLYWEWGQAIAGQTVETPTVAYLLAPGLLAPQKMAQLAKLLPTPPTEFTTGVRATEAPAWVVAAKGARAVPVPASLRPLQRGDEGAVVVPTVAGEMLVIPAAASSIDLPLPTTIETPLPKLTSEKGVADEVAQHVAEVLGHRLPDGRFEFAQGRTFYDGITCGILAQVMPILPEPLRGQTAEALGKCLDALCDGHVRSQAYGLLVPPEQESFIQSAIDYPEITATLLYAILAYTLNADPQYAAGRADLIETHYGQIGEMTTPEGLAWARADTQHMHLIAESALGGYIAWCSLYHLGKLLRKTWMSECRSRAALNWTAYRELFRWRAEFGEQGVVNGWSNWCAETKVQVPWAYVQSTWFSYVPFMTHDAEDRFGLWRSLRAQPWWEYTGAQESRQRCYDYANALALAKAGLWEAEVKPHWEAMAGRPFWWDYFDATPVTAIGALAQMRGSA